jgi:uncharacterized OB-fold protein
MPGQLPPLAIDSDSRPYWEGLTQGELRIQRCDACSRHVFYPRSICPHCSADRLSWITATGKGTIYSYTVAHQAFGPYTDEVPFVVAIVELEEGVRIMTRIVGTPPEQVRIGVAVHVTFATISEELTLPYFQLTA